MPTKQCHQAPPHCQAPEEAPSRRHPAESGELRTQGSVPPPLAQSPALKTGTPSTNAVLAQLQQQMQQMQQMQMQQMQQMQQQLSTLFAAQALGAPTSQATLAPSPAAHTQHAGSARRPAPSQDNIFHAQAAAD